MPNHAAADPKPPTERVVGLYVKGGRMSWLIMDETVDLARALTDHIFAQPEPERRKLLGIFEMHCTMSQLKRNDPQQYAEAAAAIGWEDRCHE